MRACESASETPATLAVRCQQIDGNVRYRMIYIASTTVKLARDCQVDARRAQSVVLLAAGNGSQKPLLRYAA